MISSIEVRCDKFVKIYSAANVLNNMKGFLHVYRESRPWFGRQMDTLGSRRNIPSVCGLSHDSSCYLLLTYTTTDIGDSSVPKELFRYFKVDGRYRPEAVFRTWLNPVKADTNA